MKKYKTLILFIIELIIIVVVCILYKKIYVYEVGKIEYAEQAEKFVEENKNPIFKVKKITLISKGNAVDNSDGNLKNIDISQFTDLSVEIDNTGKSSELTAENTINSMIIKDINVSTRGKNGEKRFNYKNPYDNGKYVEIDNYRNDGIVFNVLRNNEELENVNYDFPTFYTDCSNPISLGYLNKNLLTGCEVNSNNGSIAFDGSILKSANVDLKAIEPSISFNIYIKNNLNESFICNVSINVDLSTDADEGIYTGYIFTILNTNEERFNFIRTDEEK